MSLLSYFWCFLIYAFLGWVSEVSFAAAYHKTFVNRGFLNGPVCPIYGFGVVLVYFILSPISDTWLTLFIGSVVVTSALEWITGFVLEHVFHHKWWDYSDVPYNLNGYVCLTFSLLWGVACVVVVKFLIPFTDFLVSLIPFKLSIGVVAGLVGIMVGDTVVTAMSMIGLNKQLAKLEKLTTQMKKTSNALGNKISDNTIEIKKLYEEYVLSKKPSKRIIFAFPDLRATKNNEQLLAIKNAIHSIYPKSKAIVQSKINVKNMKITKMLQRIVSGIPTTVWIAIVTVTLIMVGFELLVHIKSII